MAVLWYPATFVLSALAAVFVYTQTGVAVMQFLIESDEDVDFTGNFVAEKIYAFTEWFFYSSSLLSKVLVCLGAAVIVVAMILLCCLDDYFKEMPGGDTLELIVGESVTTELKPLIILPSAVLFVYFVIYTVVSFFASDDVKFSIETLSLTGEGYGVCQWITQITFLLVLFLYFLLIFDSFLSAGFIGGVFHLIFVTVANISGMFLALVLGMLFVIVVLLALVVYIVAAVVCGVLGGACCGDAGDIIYVRDDGPC